MQIYRINILVRKKDCCHDVNALKFQTNHILFTRSACKPLSTTVQQLNSHNGENHCLTRTLLTDLPNLPSWGVFSLSSFFFWLFFKIYDPHGKWLCFCVCLCAHVHILSQENCADTWVVAISGLITSCQSQTPLGLVNKLISCVCLRVYINASMQFVAGCVNVSISCFCVYVW